MNKGLDDMDELFNALSCIGDDDEDEKEFNPFTYAAMRSQLKIKNPSSTPCRRNPERPCKVKAPYIDKRALKRAQDLSIKSTIQIPKIVRKNKWATLKSDFEKEHFELDYKENVKQQLTNLSNFALGYISLFNTIKNGIEDGQIPLFVDNIVLEQNVTLIFSNKYHLFEANETELSDLFNFIGEKLDILNNIIDLVNNDLLNEEEFKKNLRTVFALGESLADVRKKVIFHGTKDVSDIFRFRNRLFKRLKENDMDTQEGGKLSNLIQRLLKKYSNLV